MTEGREPRRDQSKCIPTPMQMKATVQNFSDSADCREESRAVHHLDIRAGLDNASNFIDLS